VLLELTYGDGPPWPLSADGLGHSLVLARPDYGQADPRSWRASSAIGGNPGAADVAVEDPAVGAMINEVRFGSSSSSDDFVELYNASAVPADLSGCVLTDGSAIRRFRIPEGTRLDAHSWRRFPRPVLGFDWPQAGATVSLLNAASTQVLDAVAVVPPQEGLSLGRFPDGMGDFRVLNAPTPEAGNARPWLPPVVFNEILFHPPSGHEGEEFIEIHNRTDAGVDVGGWRLSGGVDYTIPSGTRLAPRGYLVIARDHTNLLSRVPGLDRSAVVGDFAGTLGRGGDRLALSRPTGTGWTLVNQVAYSDDGSWGSWADGGGGSLELADPESDNTLPMNWAGSDESAKAPWTQLEASGVVDQAVSQSSRRLYIWLGGAGEMLLDDVEVRIRGGPNLVQNPGLDSDAAGWAAWGNHVQSAREAGAGYGGGAAFHLRAQAAGKIVADKLIVNLTAAVTSAAPITVRAKARWLAGDPNLVCILKGSGFELAAQPTIPAGLGTPGRVNSRRVAQAPPALSDLACTPVIPEGGAPVTVSVRVDDARGGAQIYLVWQLDGSAAVTRTPMRDDGREGDLHPHDGVYTATIPGQPAGILVAYRVEAWGADTATNSLPVSGAYQHPQALVRFGDPQQGGDFGVYRIWMRAADVAAWDAEPNECNQLWPATFIWGGFRAIHSAGIRFRGSTFSRPSFGNPVTGPPAGYVVKLPGPEPFLGSGTMNYDRMENDSGTWQRTRLTMELGRSMDAPAYHVRYVHLFMNGNRRSDLYSDAQLPDSDYIREQFPGESDGYLHESVKYSEYSDAISEEGSGRDGPFSFFVKTAGLMQKNIYRTIWERKSHGPDDDSYQSLFTLYEAMNAPSEDQLVAAFDALVDADDFMRTLAMRHLSEDQDGFGYNDMANGMIYKPVNGLWRHVPWDFDTGWGTSRSFSDPLPPIGEMQGTDPKFAQFFTRPAVQRAYWRAIRLGADWLASGAKSYLGSWNTVLHNPANLLSPPGDFASLQADLTGRAKFALTMVTNANLSVPFAVTNLDSTAGIATVTNPVITLGGTAPYAMQVLRLAGYPGNLRVRWTDVRHWQFQIGVKPGTNRFEITGWDPSGQLVGSPLQVAVRYDGDDVSPVGQVVINEYLTTPDRPRAGFVELRNLNRDRAFDLSGMRLDGPDAVIRPGTVIEAGGFVVLAEDVPAWAEAFGLSRIITVVPQNTRPLDRGQGALRLWLRDGITVVDDVAYAAGQPWAQEGWDGSGFSYQLVDPTQDHHAAWNWRAAAPSPGSDNPVATPLPRIAGVVLTEAQPFNRSTIADDTGQYPPWVELLNTGAALTLDDCFLTDDPAAPTKWRFPPGTALGMEARVLVWFTPGIEGAPGYLHASFGLNPAGGFVGFYQIAGGVTNLVSHLVFPAMAANEVIGRVPELATSPINLLDVATPGAPNPEMGQPQIRINEWLASNKASIPDPTDGQFDDWIELHNPSGRWVDLGGYALSQPGADLHRWVIPSESFVPPGGFVLVWMDGDTGAEGLHARFKLDAAGDGVVLWAPDGTRLDEVIFGSQAGDVSEGRFPDGGTARRKFPIPTPGYANGTTGPLMDVEDAWVDEGDDGVRSLMFAVTLSAPATGAIAVHYATHDRSAAAGVDYEGVSGVLEFAAGEQRREIAVPIVGDRLFEPSPRELLLWLSQPVGATVRRAVAKGTLLDNEVAMPVVDNDAPAAAVTATSANARYRLLSTGRLPTDVWLYWGMADGGTDAKSWEGSIHTGTVSQGSWEIPLTGLAPDTTYFYRVAASNGLGLAWAPRGAVFRTRDGVESVEIAIQNSADDAEQPQSGKMENPGSLVSPLLEMVFDPTGTPARSNQVVGLRFQGVPLPQGVMVLHADIQFTAAEASQGDAALTIAAQANNNAPPFAFTTSNISGRTRTTNVVAWVPGPWAAPGEQGEAERTPELRALVQEVVNRPLWQPRNAILFVLSGTGRRVAQGFDMPLGNPPRLRLNWIRLPFSELWLRQFFPRAYAPEAAPDGDPDGDGLTTLQEFVTGSNPTVPDFSLRLDAVPTGDGRIQITFPTRLAEGPGYAGLHRWYDLQSTSDPASAVWTGVGGESWIPGDNSLHRALLPAAHGPRFYRVRVRLQ
jgi:hypothetical protein